MKTAQEKNFAEFFAGIGLMRIGLERAGWKIAFANDIDEDKWRMYRDHFGDTGEFALGDVHQLDAGTVPEVALATASFPCNDLSLAGARKGLAGDQSSAFWGFIEVLTKLGNKRPPLVLLENVTGFLTSHEGNDFRDALLALNRLGYAVDTFIIDAARFVPQSRQRLFVVGTKTKTVSAINETPSFYEGDCRPPALADFILWNPEINWRIRDLPRLPEKSTSLDDILESLSPNSQAWWSQERCNYLLNQMSPKHRAVADAMISGAKTSYGTVFRRVRNGKSMAELRTDGIAGCLRTPRGGSGRQILFAAGKGKFAVRLLTGRECARLMGADDFRLTVPLNQALFGFGDAVCVPVIEWIGNHYLNPVWMENFAAVPQGQSKSQVRYRKASRR
jgi:DNA (cytosine-5)-methyltransferase 1